MDNLLGEIMKTSEKVHVIEVSVLLSLKLNQEKQPVVQGLRKTKLVFLSFDVTLG